MIGVLGGLGPAATVEFQERLLARTPADADQEHIPTFVCNDPTVPDRTDAVLSDGVDPYPHLLRNVRLLDGVGVDFIVMPSNTTHYYHADLADAVATPFPSMITVVEERLSALNVERVGIVTTRPACKSGLYDGVADEVVYADDFDRLMDAMYAYKAGEYETAGERFREAVESLDTSVDVALVACTEFSDLPWPLNTTKLDAMDVLVEYCVERHHR